MTEGQQEAELLRVIHKLVHTSDPKAEAVFRGARWSLIWDNAPLQERKARSWCLRRNDVFILRLHHTSPTLISRVLMEVLQSTSPRG